MGVDLKVKDQDLINGICNSLKKYIDPEIRRRDQIIASLMERVRVLESKLNSKSHSDSMIQAIRKLVDR